MPFGCIDGARGDQTLYSERGPQLAPSWHTFATLTEFRAIALAMLRAASLATLTVPRLLRSIAAGAWRRRSIACADAARAVVSLLPCCWQIDAGMLRPDVDAGPLQNGHGSSRTSAGELPGDQDHQCERLEARRAQLLPRRHQLHSHPLHHRPGHVLHAEQLDELSELLHVSDIGRRSSSRCFRRAVNEFVPTKQCRASRGRRRPWHILPLSAPPPCM